jgi:hypothetical protein
MPSGRAGSCPKPPPQTTVYAYSMDQSLAYFTDKVPCPNENFFHALMGGNW